MPASAPHYRWDRARASADDVERDRQSKRTTSPPIASSLAAKTPSASSGRGLCDNSLHVRRHWAGERILVTNATRLQLTNPSVSTLLATADEARIGSYRACSLTTFIEVRFGSE